MVCTIRDGRETSAHFPVGSFTKSGSSAIISDVMSRHEPTEPAEYSVRCQGEYFSGDSLVAGKADIRG